MVCFHAWRKIELLQLLLIDEIHLDIMHAGLIQQLLYNEIRLSVLYG